MGLGRPARCAVSTIWAKMGTIGRRWGCTIHRAVEVQSVCSEGAWSHHTKNNQTGLQEGMLVYSQSIITIICISSQILTLLGVLVLGFSSRNQLICNKHEQDTNWDLATKLGTTTTSWVTPKQCRARCNLSLSLSLSHRWQADLPFQVNIMVRCNLPPRKPSCSETWT